MSASVLTGPIALLRNEPVQARSTARLTSLLDAAAAVVAELGYERLTTAMVAERAGSSIGTVYRYFPDRIAVLQALSARSLSNFAAAGIDQINGADNTTWLETFDSALDYLVEAFENEPGFRSLRFGDVLDLRPHTDGQTSYGIVAGVIVSAVTTKHGLESSADLAFDVEVALQLADALLTRAFALDEAGEQRFIAEARAISRGYLLAKYGDTPAT